jgi:integrase
MSAEIDRLIAAARRLGRHGHRDATMILLAYRHGLRVSELVSLRREQLDLRQGLTQLIESKRFQKFRGFELGTPTRAIIRAPS